MSEPPPLTSRLGTALANKNEALANRFLESLTAEDHEAMLKCWREGLAANEIVRSDAPVPRGEKRGYRLVPDYRTRAQYLKIGLEYSAAKPAQHLEVTRTGDSPGITQNEIFARLLADPDATIRILASYRDHDMKAVTEVGADERR